MAEDARTDETGEQFSAEYRLLTRDGSMVWVRDEATLVSDEDGRPLCWQGVLTDVADRKQAEEALKESEQRFRSWSRTHRTSSLWWGPTARFST